MRINLHPSAFRIPVFLLLGIIFLTSCSRSLPPTALKLNNEPLSKQAMAEAHPRPDLQQMHSPALAPETGPENMETKDKPLIKTQKPRSGRDLGLTEKQKTKALTLAQKGSSVVLTVMPHNPVVRNVMSANHWAKAHAPAFGILISLATLVLLVLLIIILARQI